MVMVMVMVPPALVSSAEGKIVQNMEKLLEFDRENQEIFASVRCGAYMVLFFFFFFFFSSIM